MVAAGRARLALSSVARREAPRSALQRSSFGSLEDAASFEEVRQDLRAIARFCHEQAELSPASSRAGLASALSRIGARVCFRTAVSICPCRSPVPDRAPTRARCPGGTGPSVLIAPGLLAIVRAGSRFADSRAPATACWTPAVPMQGPLPGPKAVGSPGGSRRARYWAIAQLCEEGGRSARRCRFSWRRR
jgi:hypothetical protein